MVNGRYTDLLIRYGTDARRHSGRSLFDHLIGTHQLLEKWGNADPVCLAGLFHSVYGTSHFTAQSVHLDNRREIAAVIGDRAEELAYLFCVTDRSGFFQQANESCPALRNHVTDQQIITSTEVIADLIEIELANYVDQFDPALTYPKSFLNRIDCMIEMGAARMSPPAKAAFVQMREGVALRPSSGVTFRLAYDH